MVGSLLVCCQDAFLVSNLMASHWFTPSRFVSEEVRPAAASRVGNLATRGVWRRLAPVCHMDERGVQRARLYPPWSSEAGHGASAALPQGGFGSTQGGVACSYTSIQAAEKEVCGQEEPG